MIDNSQFMLRYIPAGTINKMTTPPSLGFYPHPIRRCVLRLHSCLKGQKDGNLPVDHDEMRTASFSPLILDSHSHIYLFAKS